MKRITRKQLNEANNRQLQGFDASPVFWSTPRRDSFSFAPMPGEQLKHQIGNELKKHMKRLAVSTWRIISSRKGQNLATPATFTKHSWFLTGSPEISNQWTMFCLARFTTGLCPVLFKWSAALFPSALSLSLGELMRWSLERIPLWSPLSDPHWTGPELFPSGQSILLFLLQCQADCRHQTLHTWESRALPTADNNYKLNMFGKSWEGSHRSVNPKKSANLCRHAQELALHRLEGNHRTVLQNSGNLQSVKVWISGACCRSSQTRGTSLVDASRFSLRASQ